MKRTVKIGVIGTSAGGLHALKTLLPGISRSLSFPILIVMHRLKDVDNTIEEVFSGYTELIIKEAENREELQAGKIYISPANHHMLVNRDHRINLKQSEPVNYSRPSIDVSMINVGEVYGKDSLGVILTGANHDGANGLRLIHEKGGLCVVQDPSEAQVPVMPETALRYVPEAQKMKLREIGHYISRISAAKK